MIGLGITLDVAERPYTHRARAAPFAHDRAALVGRSAANERDEALAAHPRGLREREELENGRRDVDGRDRGVDDGAFGEHRGEREHERDAHRLVPHRVRVAKPRRPRAVADSVDLHVVLDREGLAVIGGDDDERPFAETERGELFDEAAHRVVVLRDLGEVGADDRIGRSERRLRDTCEKLRARLVRVVRGVQVHEREEALAAALTEEASRVGDDAIGVARRVAVIDELGEPGIDPRARVAGEEEVVHEAGGTDPRAAEKDGDEGRVAPVEARDRLRREDPRSRVEPELARPRAGEERDRTWARPGGRARRVGEGDAALRESIDVRCDGRHRGEPRVER